MPYGLDRSAAFARGEVTVASEKTVRPAAAREFARAGAV
jgi:hypothetical protein